MNSDAWLGLLPLGALVFSLLALLLPGAFFPRHRGLWGITVIGMVAALVALPPVAKRLPIPVTIQGATLLAYDAGVVFFTALILMAGLAVTLISWRYLSTRSVHNEAHHREYYLLLLLTLVGALLLVASRHSSTLFLGLEIMSVALFGLIAYRADHLRALEAGVKYLVLSGTSSALLLLGLALLYAATGSLSFEASAAPEMMELARAGTLLAIVGFGFKLSLVPFHMWTPDVYEGAPAPVSALLASVSKAAVAAALWQWLNLNPLGRDDGVLLALTALAMLSMLAGNLLCLWQENIKRLLAYSSVGHMGFWLVPLAVAGPLSGEAAGYYLAAYVASVLAAFGAVAYLSSEAPEELVQVSGYRGLFWHHPLAAAVLTVALLSLAGIPLTVGFIAKFYVFAAGVEGARWGLVAAVAVSSAIAIYYYLRVITALFVPGISAALVSDRAGRGVLLFLLLFIVFYGVLPTSLIDTVRLALQ